MPAHVARVPLAAILLAACGGGGGGAVDAYVPPRASADPQVAFEGQERMVIEISADGADLSSAVIEPAEADSPLDVVEQRCRGTRCGVVLRVRDTIPNTGVAVPAPIDGRNHELRVVTPGGDYLALLSVLPLDVIASTSRTPATIRGTLLASSADVSPEAIFDALDGGAPVRWVVFGGAAMHGMVDISAGGAGGAAGGELGAAAGGVSGGAAATGTGGAGGGGARDEGEPGSTTETPAGIGGSGGGGDGLAFAPCTAAFDALATCGGGGGGGSATAPGGAGGGTFVLASLGPMDLADAHILASGAPGADASGGGAGGNVLLAAPSVVAPAEISLDGGDGGASASVAVGGAGARGRARVDSFTGDVSDAARGPSVDVSSVPALSDAPSFLLRGRAAPGAAIEIEPIDGGTITSGTADATDGTFAIEVPLDPGINRFAVRATADGETLRSWVGTSVDFDPFPALALALPVGGAVDVVYLP